MKPYESVLLQTAGGQGIDVPECFRGRYSEDKFFEDILRNPGKYTDFREEDGLVFKRMEDTEVLKETLYSLRDEVWWKTMVSDVEEFCKSCRTCLTSKPSNQKPMGLLKTLPVPRRPWQAIGMDFVGPLPESRNQNGNFNMICAIIDHLTAMVHLTPTRQTYGAKQIAEVVFDSVYKLHGLPE
jgi:hypothetical protein